MRGADWEHFHHGADIGVRGFGNDVSEAFAHAALALTAVVTDPGSVLPRQTMGVSLEAMDLEMLLFDWLNEIVFAMAARRMLFGRFEVDVDTIQMTLRATARGEPVDPRRHAPAVEVKGVTMTELKVARLDDGRWVAQCVVDV